ncbi:hypothetical protein CAPTEDRAFT_190142 [Capitella teleta]|uniref:G-protein coupled receptors family 1 profile domain-containing protein n=1 Tax=Capitella teleta TaxID=283909 RepID=R7UL03_CAPTE|nr:hypothetical protein CAPTEDRAFT_190142 [Capitella teleta]|eukprot:ELU07219.1 hypothetical protein CAPTEDRAFT_190142 [Capitella teleta]
MSVSHFTVQSSTLDTRMVTNSPVLEEACIDAAWCLKEEPESLISYGNGSSNLTEYDNSTPEVSAYEKAAILLRTQAIVGICIIGLLGNILNLLFMTPRIIRRGGTMGRITQYSYAGMIALATSDFNFCLLGVIPLFIDDFRRSVCHLNFSMIYHVYNNALFNLFLLESTWLTVAMAVGRYLAICHPFRAKQWIGMKMFWRSIVVLTLLCVAFNIPRFWTYELVTYDCNGTTVYRLHHGFLKKRPLFETVYQWAYFVLGIVIPLITLSYCNIFLIKALRSINNNGPAMPAGARGNQESTRHITLTFVAIIIIYIILVTPSEILGFLRKHILTNQTGSNKEKYNLIVDISNTLQAVNFSLNFIVYCIINTSFRNSIINVFRCIFRPRAKMNNKDMYTSMATNSTMAGGYHVHGITHSFSFFGSCPDNDID